MGNNSSSNEPVIDNKIKITNNKLKIKTIPLETIQVTNNKIFKSKKVRLDNITKYRNLFNNDVKRVPLDEWIGEGRSRGKEIDAVALGPPCIWAVHSNKK
jgi:hypothetical protein